MVDDEMARMNLHSTMVGLKQHIDVDTLRYVTYLHSTMVGLKPNLLKLVSWVWCRFTFHYGRIKTIRKQSTFTITGIFTFHYGRIKTNNIIEELCPRNLFTFHYGRIKTIAEYKEWYRQN